MCHLAPYIPVLCVCDGIGMAKEKERIYDFQRNLQMEISRDMTPENQQVVVIWATDTPLGRSLLNSWNMFFTPIINKSKDVPSYPTETNSGWSVSSEW